MFRNFLRFYRRKSLYGLMLVTTTFKVTQRHGWNLKSNKFNIICNLNFWTNYPGVRYLLSCSLPTLYLWFNNTSYSYIYQGRIIEGGGFNPLPKFRKYKSNYEYSYIPYSYYLNIMNFVKTVINSTYFIYLFFYFEIYNAKIIIFYLIPILCFQWVINLLTNEFKYFMLLDRSCEFAPL